MQLCLLAAGATIRLGTVALTLAWTHSIEKTRWEEDWRATPAGLVLEEDRIQSTGAGMEPPPDAHFDGQWWHYSPKTGADAECRAASLRRHRRLEGLHRRTLSADGRLSAGQRRSGDAHHLPVIALHETELAMTTKILVLLAAMVAAQLFGAQPTLADFYETQRRAENLHRGLPENAARLGRRLHRQLPRADKLLQADGLPG